MLFFDFRYKGNRCREQTLLPDIPANRKKLAAVLTRIQAEITLDTFNYRSYFPNSELAERFEAMAQSIHPAERVPLLRDFAEEWFEENAVTWKRSMQKTVRCNLHAHVIPKFGALHVNHIAKSDILKFRAELSKGRSGSGKPLSADRINHIMTTLRLILAEASDRFCFATPFQGIKALPIPRTDVDPFSIQEVRLILENVRPDFRNYYTVRFLTGLRTGEIDGLKWKYVDFERHLVLIRETVVDGEPDTPKTLSSTRDVRMSQLVFEALLSQQPVTGGWSEYVFCTRVGKPLCHRNITKRVWYPMLGQLALKKRRPYQTRHTAATLWLAAGENPEWIARQLGHSSTQMLFQIYSRFVPNLTRQDGTAADRLLHAYLWGATRGTKHEAD